MRIAIQELGLFGGKLKPDGFQGNYLSWLGPSRGAAPAACAHDGSLRARLDAQLLTGDLAGLASDLRFCQEHDKFEGKEVMLNFVKDVVHDLIGACDAVYHLSAYYHPLQTCLGAGPPARYGVLGGGRSAVVWSLPLPHPPHSPAV